MALKIYLFGKFEVHRDGRLVLSETWRTEQNKNLLKLLLTEPGEAFSQDAMLECLWPEQDPQKSARNLRSRISELRKILQPRLKKGSASTFIKTVNGGYCFVPRECFVDTEHFRDLYRQGKEQESQGQIDQARQLYREAKVLYRGEWLAEDRYQAWTQAPRERWHQRYLEMLTHLIEIAEAQQSHSEVCDYCEEALAVDPYSEKFYRRLLECQSEMGQPQAAVQTYERYCKMLSEIDAKPSPEIEALYSSIRDRVRLGTAHDEATSALREIERRLERSAGEARLALLRQKSKHLEILGRRAEQSHTLDEALACALTLSDLKALGAVHGQRANFFRDTGDLTAARAETQKAYQAFRTTHDTVGVARSLGMLGILCQDQGELDAARAKYEEELSLLQNLRSPEADRSRLSAWANLARIEIERQNYSLALAHLDRAYRLSAELGDQSRQATILLNLGALYYQWDRPGEARLHWEQCQALAHRIGALETESRCWNNLALLRNNEDDLEGALTLYERAIALQEQIRDLIGLAETHNNLGIVYDRIGQWEKALEAYERARACSETLGDTRGVAMEWNNLAGIHIERRRYALARKLLEQALAVFEQLGDRWWQAQALMRLGWLYQERDRHAEALPYLERAAAVSKEIESASLEITNETRLAVTRLALGQASEALALARSIEKKLQISPPGEHLVPACYRLHQVFSALGKSREAKRYLKRAYENLQALDRSLKNPDFRKSLWRVRLHREIQNAWERRSRS